MKRTLLTQYSLQVMVTSPLDERIRVPPSKAKVCFRSLYIFISIIVVEVLVSQQSEEASEIARRNHEKITKLFWSYGSDLDFLEVCSLYLLFHLGFFLMSRHSRTSNKIVI